MLPESNHTPRIKQDYSHLIEEANLGTPTSANSSGRFKKIVRQTASSAQAKQSVLKLNLYKPMLSSTGNSSDSLELRGKPTPTNNQHLLMYKQTISSFLKMATRDLRAPLAILRTGLAVLKRLNKDEQDAELIEEMERALARTTNVIGTYLELDQCESLARLELHCEPISIRALLEEEISKLSAVIPEATLSKIRIQNFVPEKATMWADRNKISQVFAILLGRAVRHSAADGTVALEHHSTSATEVVEISCQGRCIGAETLDALSSPFLDKTKEKLTRLDLQAAQKLIEVHQGKLLFDSEARHGNRIWVVLPRTSR